MSTLPYTYAFRLRTQPKLPMVTTDFRILPNKKILIKHLTTFKKPEPKIGLKKIFDLVMVPVH